VESIEKVQKRARKSMAYALQRQAVAQQTAYESELSSDDPSERNFPVILKPRDSLTIGEASNLIDSILDEHFDTIESLAK
jgi:hypothetical protein